MNRGIDVLVIYGTRPEVIKLSPPILALQKTRSPHLCIVASGQHADLVEGISELWNISADVTLPITRGASINQLLPNLIQHISQLLEHLQPKLVIVQGDTSTALAATLAAFSSSIPVAHVEAGLRSFNNMHPWPEEGFRRSIDGMSSLLFAPTARAEDNLRSERLPGLIRFSGNTIVDALVSLRDRIRFDESQIPQLPKHLATGETPFVLFTQHRRESFGNNIERVFAAVRALAEDGHHVVFPVHPNPEVLTRAHRMLGTSPNITLLPPLNYLHFLKLLDLCSFVISDSGGLQEEVPTFGKRILITRTATERPEILESGHGILCGYETDRIVQEALRIVNLPSIVDTTNPFGDGNASERICSDVCSFLAHHS